MEPRGSNAGLCKWGHQEEATPFPDLGERGATAGPEQTALEWEVLLTRGWAVDPPRRKITTPSPRPPRALSRLPLYPSLPT